MKFLLLQLFLINIIYVPAQVGINSENPLGIFHIDGKSNTLKEGLVVTNTEDDVIIFSDIEGLNWNIGGTLQNSSPKISSKLALLSNNRAFIPNRVKLTGTYDLTTIPNPENGMIVYNLEPTFNSDNNVIPGYYLFQEGIWLRLSTESYTGSISNLGLKTSVVSSPISNATEEDAMDATEMDFGDIIVYEEGPYAFSINFRGKTESQPSAQYIVKTSYFIYLMSKTEGETEYKVRDWAEICPPAFPDGSSFSYNLPMSFYGKSGDKVILRIGHSNTTPKVTLLDELGYGTFLSYWKLN